MGLKPCKECGKEVSTSASKCPHCGRKYPTGGMSLPLKIFLGVVGLALIGQLIGNSSGPATSRSPSSPPPRSFALGDHVQTDYFVVTVNSADITDRIRTGNQFTEELAPAGSKYLVLSVTVKNSDAESRMFLEGDAIAVHEGRELVYDKSEAVIGYTFALATLNPLTEQTSHIVYELPMALTGPVYWRPGRSSVRIYVGDIPPPPTR